METATKTFTIDYREYASIEALAADDRELMEAAIAATATAYAPYSHFSVGAALRLDDGTIVSGSNQENIAYPSGLCAERTALFAAGAQHPDRRVATLAIVARDPQGSLAEASPCGACRQVLVETQQRGQAPIRTLLYLSEGRIREIADARQLLPFSFSM
ncbi:MAG: cytidine deaminase [Bacteroidales bacterium]|nr:cytidine deaminase [Bacteroidales bacterium]